MPGSGTTVLWQEGVKQARERFAHVLTCRGAEAEAALSFAGLSELLSEVLGQAVDSLLPPRRRALEVALLLAEPGEGSPDPLAIGLAVHDLLRVLAQQGPVLVAVDDVQWLDPASAGVLEVALRRLRTDPIGLLVTSRRTAGAAIPLGLKRSPLEQRLTVLSVGPLSLGALHHLLGERLDQPAFLAGAPSHPAGPTPGGASDVHSAGSRDSGVRGRADARPHPVVPEHPRVAWWELAAGARAGQRRLRLRRADAVRKPRRLEGPCEGSDRDGSWSRGAGAGVGRGGPGRDAGDRERVFCLLSLGVLGRLELALGNVQEAGRYLSELPSRLITSG
jgi:hypothetical protein